VTYYGVYQHDSCVRRQTALTMAKCGAVCGKALFRVGQILITWGFVCVVVSMLTAYWVVRPAIDYSQEGINPNETKVTKNYGIFRACRQDASFSSSRSGKSKGKCGSLWDNLNYISANTARYIQFVMVVACIMYVCGLVLEIVQVLPIRKYRNFLAQNRVVEIFSSIATVLVLKGMLIFAGEIRNKAERVSGQDIEETGWSFIIAVIGLTSCVGGVMLTTMFRHLPRRVTGEKGGSWLKSDHRA